MGYEFHPFFWMNVAIAVKQSFGELWPLTNRVVYDPCHVHLAEAVRDLSMDRARRGIARTDHLSGRD